MLCLNKFIKKKNTRKKYMERTTRIIRPLHKMSMEIALTLLLFSTEP